MRTKPHDGGAGSIAELGYCGLYCGLCAARRRIPARAAELRDLLAREGYAKGRYDVEGLAATFQEFWRGLGLLAEHPCPGCRADAGRPSCPIRECARSRDVEVCPLCPDYPCHRFAVLRHHPNLSADGERLRSVGLEQWLREQEKRAASGFTYADIRLPDEP